jgi:hypothetical protein
MSDFVFGPQLGSMYHQGRGANVIDMPYSELKKKYDVTTTGVSNDYMQNYQRNVLADRRNEPKSFDHEENRDTKHFSRSMIQHRYGGMRQGRTPDMPEINTEMMDFEPRGVSTDPDMSKLAADTWAREYHLRRMVYPDKSEDFVTDAPISQWEIGPLKKATHHNVKNRTIIFDTSYDNHQFGIKPPGQHRSMVNVTLADDTAYGELAKMVEGQVVNRTNDLSKAMPSNTGLIHHITTDVRLPVGGYGGAPRSYSMGASSVNHKNFQYQEPIYKVPMESFQARNSAKMYIDGVLRNVNYDGTLRESADTPVSRRAKELSNVLSSLYVNAAGAGVGEMKSSDSKDTMTSKRPTQDLQAKLINMITEDAKLRKMYIESFNTKQPALSEFNSLMTLVLTDNKELKRSEDSNTIRKIKHFSEDPASKIQHFTGNQKSISGKHDQKNTHVYTSSNLPAHLGADSSKYATDDRITRKDHRDTPTFRSVNPVMINNFLDNPDTDFTANDHVFNKGSVVAARGVRHSKMNTIAEGSGSGLSEGFGDSFSGKHNYGEVVEQPESRTWRR